MTQVITDWDIGLMGQ